MSFRNAYVTDFIYAASEELMESNKAVEAVFAKYSRHVASKVDDRGYGIYSGIFSSLDGSFEDMGINEITRELEKATKKPFRIAVLMESGPVMIYDIEPRAE